jgi:nucleoside-diphosphate kinase
MEQTFLMVKPDGVSRGLMGEVISRIENKGLRISAMKMMDLDEEQAEKHYQEHADKAFFNDLISFITSGPVLTMIVEGEEAIKVVRSMVGSTDPKEASQGTIRGNFATEIGSNIVHASDSSKSAKREIELFFS